MDSGVTKDSNVSQTAGRWGWGQRGLGASGGLVLGGLHHIRPGCGDVVALELVSTCWWSETKSWGELLPCGRWNRKPGSRAAGLKGPRVGVFSPSGQSWGLGVSRSGAYLWVGEAGRGLLPSQLLGRDSPRVSCCRHGGFRAQ